MDEELEIQITDLEFVYFFADNIHIRGSRLSVDIEDVTGETFVDGSEIITPGGETAPPEFPIMQKKSQDGKFDLTVSKEKATLFYHVPESSRDSDITELKETCDSVRTLIEEYLLEVSSVEVSSGINRFGFIVHYFIPSESPDDMVRSKFLPELSEDTTGILLQYNQRFTIGGDLQLNNVVSFNPGILNATHQEGLVIKRDINTVKENNYDLELDTFSTIISESLSHMSGNEIRELIVDE